MAVKWIWGFETGADETFYSGSGWSRCDSLPYPSASGIYDELGFYTDGRNRVDYSCNFPHQPPSDVGGGQYSLKVEPGSIYSIAIGQTTWQNFHILSPTVWKDGIVPDTGTLSFSIFNNSDSTAWETGSNPPHFGTAQRFLSLYPSDVGVKELASGSFVGALEFLSGSLMSGTVMAEVPPMLQLFVVKSKQIPGGKLYNGIFAFCITGIGPAQAAPVGPAFDYMTGVSLGSYSWASVISSSLKNQSLAGQGTYNTDYPMGGYGYTGSDGFPLLENNWNKIAVEYYPDPVAGSLKVSLNGTDIIDISGVPTGYTGSTDPNGAPLNLVYDNQRWGRVSFTPCGFYTTPNPWATDPSSEIQPATFWYDHVCAFDNTPTNDWATATSSIFIDRFIPDQDISTGSYVGNDSGTADLYDYIDDTNYYLNNSYLRTDNTASDRELKVSTTGIYETKAGHPTWSVGNISEIIGLNSINLVSSSADLGLYGASLMWDAGLANDEITGPYSLVSGKKFIESVSGETALGASWNYLTGNSGGGPGSQILHSGFKFGPLPESYTVTLAGGNLRFDSWASEISMFIKESGSGDILVTWPVGAALNDPVTWTWNTADALKDFVSGDTYYLDVQEDIGDNFFFGASSSSISFTVENDEISSGFTDPVPTNVGDLFLNISHTVGEAARFYFIYNGTSSAPTNPTPGTSGERYGP